MNLDNEVVDDHQRVLIIGFVWPEPDSSAAGSRMMQLISLFLSKDWEVTFASPAAESDYQANLESLDVATANIQVNNSEFDDFITNLKPTVVLFDRFITEEQFGWRVAKHCPEALRILDTEDLHCLRRTRQKAVEQERDFRRQDLLTEEVTKREIAGILRSDLSLIISGEEFALLKDFFEIDSGLLHYLPFMVEPISETTIESWPGFDERNHFVTIGNFSHEPNWDAVKYLNNDIWPLIREELPETKLHIYGAYPTRKARELHNPEKHFYINGRVDDAKKVVSNARVLLAPLRFGAGLKGKLIEAMQCGTPNVTTDIGAEGIPGAWEWSGMIANTPSEIADAASVLYSNLEMWIEAQKNGVQIINNRFREDDFKEALIDRILGIQQNLDLYRRNNFTGAMLMHHTMASTEYMSRWIESKNRDKD